MKRSLPGYTLIFSLMIVGLVMIMIVGLVSRARIHNSTMILLLDREKARLLALSGLELAKSKLANPSPPQQESGSQDNAVKNQKPDPVQQDRDLLGFLLPQLLTGQTFIITEDKKTPYGDIKICVGSEQGKLNLNLLYDFNQHKFLAEDDPQRSAKILLEQVCKSIEKRMGGSRLFEKLSAFLKERSYPLNDITELFAIKEFAIAFRNAVFLEPVINKKMLSERSKETEKLYFTDLFTIWSKKQQVEPWLLSPSLQKALDFTMKEQSTEKIKQSLEQFAQRMVWKQSWNKVLAPLYGKDFASLPPSLESLLSTEFEPMVFSVVSYGSVKNSTQKLYAIVERSRSQDQSGPMYEIQVKRLYWL